MTEPTHTRPARKRTAATAENKLVAKAASRPTKATKAVAAVEVAEDADTVQKFRVELVHVKTTSNYERFEPPKSSGCTGAFYAPLGATSISVLVKGVDS